MIEQIFQEVNIHPQLVIVVPALMVVGYALKVTPFIKDWMIIWVLLICGVIASGLRLGFDVNGIANGLIAAGAAITTHQFFKQSIQKKK